MRRLIAVFVIPVAVQWWNVWYSGSEPGGGGYIVSSIAIFGFMALVAMLVCA